MFFHIYDHLQLEGSTDTSAPPKNPPPYIPKHPCKVDPEPSSHELDTNSTYTGEITPVTHL